ncbi:GNAT family N-acetyltransferase [Eudoraea chungangensis]|uniref:GNAT family N-acetyltransferase n=1 Tax=Eudoraea chungangensis TaxID=1481905 RepID=UPI0023EC44FA|nr:GNAT family N-acetyltransferase [Eudoraea chungangensis]
MKIVLETKRLLLREFVLDDARNMFNLNSDPEVIRYTGDQAFRSVDDARLFIESYKEYSDNGFGRWAVVEKKRSVFIGWCGFKRNEEDLIDLGFRFFKKQWNKGFATEAAKATLAYGFGSLNFDRIIGRAAKDNVASIKVLNKIGMQYYKVDECHGIHDAHYYVIHRENYKLLDTKS